MRKIFLIPLLTLMCSVMAWGAVVDVARVGDVVYQSNTALSANNPPIYKSDAAAFTAAITAANSADGQTVVLLKTIAKATSESSDKKTISANMTIDGQGQYSIPRSFTVNEGKTLTLKDVTVNDGYKCTPAGAVVLNNGATLVMNNATIAPTISGVLPVRTVQGASATIQLALGSTNVIRNNGGTALYAYNQAAGDNSSVLTITGDGALNVYHTGTGGYALSAHANGGCFLINAPNVTFIPSDPTKFIGANAKLADGYLALYEDGAYKVLPTSDSRVVAEVNGMAYSSLAAAVEAASANAEITLWADAPATTIAKSLVIKSNGYNASAITAASGYARVAIDGGYAFGKVNKEGNVYTVSTFDEFLFAANYAAVDGDVIKLTADIDYGTAGGTNYLNIKKSITLDGQGHTLTGACKRANADFWATLYVNEKEEDVAMMDIVIKDITLVNNKKTSSYGASIRFQHNINTVTLTNVVMDITGGVRGNSAPMFLGGSDTNNPTYTLNNCRLLGKNSDYPYYSWIKAHIIAKDTYFNGYCGMYFKDGSNGTVVDADNCNFDAPNEHNGTSNAFSCFACEDSGITLNLNNCGMNASQLGDQNQALVLASASTATSKRADNIIVNISGDNSYFNCGGGMNKLIENDWYSAGGAFYFEEHGDIVLTITGGTYSTDPREIAWYGNWEDPATYSINVLTTTIPDGYEVKEITTQQGGLQTTLYRVRKEIKTSYNINDNAEGEGDGQNEHTEFIISGSSTEQSVGKENVDTVVANYIEVSDNATLTVPEDKVLVVTNGLDVTDGATVDVQAGSTLIVGEGGVTSENVESIVIEANEQGSASFLLAPEVIVNTTPNITIKMTAKQIGYEMDGSERDFFWFRFAAPVADIQGFDKDKDRPTYIYKWDYTADDWASISALGEMEPFQGYTLTTNHEGLEDVTYTFKGRLAGNQDIPLQFKSRGFNFFGNSYTGYMDIHALVDQLMNHEAIDGTVYLWDQGAQSFYPTTLGDLADADSAEVAPMQTFILRQINTGEQISTTVNYASAIWGNPRYGLVDNNTPSLAPKRVNNDVTKMTIVVSAENGKTDRITFKESDEYSDEFNKGFDAVKFMNENQINLYATIDNENYGSVATDNIEGKLINIQTVKALNYTMSFKNVRGEEYAIRDNATNKVIAIEEGASYEFAAQPNSTVEGRFEIVDRANVVTSIDNAQDNKANVKGIYTIMGQYVGENFDVLPTGVYVVDGVKIVK